MVHRLFRLPKIQKADLSLQKETLR